ncbi:MAG: PQQ-binding-like beta-propeller repeat protein, partial [Myxococcales bacterium]
RIVPPPLPRLRPAARIRWSFRTEDADVLHRPAVGPDRTLYVADDSGLLHAIDDDGAVRWTYDAARHGGGAGTGGEGPVARDADGTLYLAFNPGGGWVELHAVSPDGAPKWVVRFPGRSTIAGPAVGPDGDVYVIHAEGFGLSRVGADGRVLWSNGAALTDRSSLGAELVFGPDSPRGQPSQLYAAFDMRAQPQLPPSPGLFAFGLEGRLRFRTEVGRLTSPGGQRDGQPAVGASGTVFLSTTAPGQAFGVHAFDSRSGRRLWSWYEPPGNVLSEPVAMPDGGVLVVRNLRQLTALDANGSKVWNQPLGLDVREGPVLTPDGRELLLAGTDGEHVRVEARSAAGGALKWQEPLPLEPGTLHVPSCRMSVSPDGARAYVQISSASGDGARSWRVFALELHR